LSGSRRNRCIAVNGMKKKVVKRRAEKKRH
jgi:hypothetical protein